MSMLIIYCTCPDRATGERLSEALVGEQLAACVNLIPGIQSCYRWQGEICRDEECLLLIKTDASRYNALEKRIVELHPYELPEIVAVEVKQGLPGYLRWVAEGGGQQH